VTDCHGYQKILKSNKMKKIIIPALIFILASCTGVKVTNQWDKSVDFKTFKTYSLYPWDKQNDKVINDYDKKTIINAIKNEMETRGYKLVEKNGDLIVSTYVILENKTSYQSYSNHYNGWAGYGGGWGYVGAPGYYGYGWGPGFSSTTVYSTDYTQGTLIIDIFRLADKKLVWQGIGTGEVTEDLAKRDRRLPMTIGHIFRRFPVSQKSQKK
jgi:hypothetical protein